LAAKRGRVSFFGGLPKTSPFASINANLIHYRELFVMGAHGSMPRHNRSALEMLASGRTHAASLIGLVVPLEKIAEAFNAVAQGKVLKAVVQPNA
jgi:L-iditol 2-dehydrogenase